MRTALQLLPGVLRVEMSTRPFVKPLQSYTSHPPFMPTNITVVTVSFIKSFLLSLSLKKKKKEGGRGGEAGAISVIDPEQLCRVFCLLGRRVY